MTEEPSTNKARPKARGLFSPTRLTDGRRLFWWAEILAVLAFYGVYTTIRNTNEGSDAEAFSNAKQLIKVQQWIGINHEETLQDWVLHFKPLIILMNYFYGSLHFIVTIGVAVWLFKKFSDDYPLWRNTLAATTGLALIGFRFWPLMPPRLLPESYGFVDTLAKYPTFWSFNSGAVAEVSNRFAAMPSVHVAWALWSACILIPRVQHRWAKIAAVGYPVLTVAVIVLTGNHYILDAVGGVVILGIGYLVGTAIDRRRHRHALAQLAPG